MFRAGITFVEVVQVNIFFSYITHKDKSKIITNEIALDIVPGSVPEFPKQSRHCAGTFILFELYSIFGVFSLNDCSVFRGELGRKGAGERVFVGGG